MKKALIIFAGIFWTLIAYLFTKHATSASIFDSSSSSTLFLSDIILTKIFYSAFFTLGILGLSYLFIKKALNRSFSLKGYFLIFLFATLVWFAVIFPWKALIVIKIPAPPQVISSHYKMDTWSLDNGDPVSIKFDTRSDFEEIISFYKSSGKFKSGSFDISRINEGEWVDVYLTDGTRVVFWVGKYPDEPYRTLVTFIKH